MPEDHSSCTLRWLPTEFGIWNFSFVYWCPVSPSICMTSFLQLGHKWNKNIIIIFLFGRLSKSIPGDLLQLHQKIMALSAIKTELNKSQTYAFNTNSAFLTCCSYFQWPKLNKPGVISNHILKLRFTHGQEGQKHHRRRVGLQIICRIF